MNKFFLLLLVNFYSYTGFVIAGDIQTGAQQVNNLQASNIANGNRSLQSQLINDRGLFEGMVERMVQSGADRTVDDLEWTFSIEPMSIRAGRGRVKVPVWAGARLAKTWKIHTFIDRNNISRLVNCAAYALIFAQTTSDHRNRDQNMLKRAWDMTIKYQWFESAPAKDILTKFINDNSSYRLTIIIPGHTRFDEFTNSGLTFEYQTNDTGAPTPACKKKMIYLYFECGYGGTDPHYAQIEYPLTALGKDSRYFEWCHKCVRIFSRISRAARTCPSCSTDDQMGKRAEARFVRSKKAKLLRDAKPCEYCGEAPCGKVNCTRKCPQCQVNLKKGYDLSRDEGHRCIIRNIEEDPVLWQPDDPVADETTRKRDKVLRQIWVYDFESLIERVPGVLDEMFVTENHGFTRRNNQLVTTTVERSRHQVNMVVCMNLFDPSQMRVFKTGGLLSPLDDFMTFILTHNNGHNTAIAHNAGGYDTRFIYEYACTNQTAKEIKPLISGCKFMELKIGKTFFRDSLLHLTGSLANLAKAFNLKMRKGYFPHLFNTVENYNYVGPIPDAGYYDLTFSAKSDSDIQKFKEWHASQRFYIF